jgi:hypothetical protein
MVMFLNSFWKNFNKVTQLHLKIRIVFSTTIFGWIIQSKPYRGNIFLKLYFKLSKTRDDFKRSIL